MKYCRYCGKEIDDDSSFCTHCGKSVDSPNKSGSKGNMHIVLLSYIHGCAISVKNFLVHIFSFKINPGKSEKLKKVAKKICKVICLLLIIGIIVGGALWAYDYYTNTYIPEKLLNEAVADITKKYESSNDSVKAELAVSILSREKEWGYENVNNYDITDRLYGLRENAFNFIESQAYKEIPRYQYILGRIYYNEDVFFINKDESKAAYWWGEAANNGFIRAYNNIGVAYERGIGVKQDYYKAIEWLKKGAEAGEEWSQYNYGNLFIDGVKVHSGSHIEKVPQYILDQLYGYERVTIQDSTILIPRDIESAKYWWRKSAAQGNTYAKEKLQHIYN